jgi:hypothetical protein
MKVAASMADAVCNDTTSWIPFRDYCVRREVTLPIEDVVAREREAQRLALAQVCDGALEVRWRDAAGREHTGLPAGWLEVLARYDPYRDVLFERLPRGRVLYQPQVRERRRVADRPTGVTTPTSKPVVTGDDPKTVTPPKETSAPVEMGEPVGQEPDEADEFVKPDESGEPDTGREPAELSGQPEEWPWRRNTALRKKDGSELRRIQLACEQLENEGKINPSIQRLSVAKIREALTRAGVSAVGDSSVRRAFGKK